MADLKAAKQQLVEMKKQQAEIAKKKAELETQLQQEKLGERLKDFPKYIFENLKVTSMILEYPTDELRVILYNFCVSNEFTETFAKAVQLSSNELEKLRNRKKEKAERRKVKSKPALDEQTG